MNKNLLLFLLFLSATNYAQIKATVVDASTNQPIPYVNIWVEGEDKGTTADENGVFGLLNIDSSKRILLNSLGYAPLYVQINDIKDVILLDPKIIELDEVVITGHKAGKERFVIRPLKKLTKVKARGCGGTSRMIARYIPYKPEYAKTPYLHTVRFPTQKYNKSFIFNLRLCSVHGNGSPGEPIYNENILVTIPANKEQISVDLSALNIKMPEEGMFIVVEKYLIKQNISGTVYEKLLDKNNNPIPAKDRKYLYDVYGPVLICEKTVTSEYGWSYYNGRWNQEYHIQIVAPPEKTDQRGIFAVEVTLTD